MYSINDNPAFLKLFIVKDNNFKIVKAVKSNFHS